jgi:DNA (cytosine-5)-methyltransferase 1
MIFALPLKPRHTLGIALVTMKLDLKDSIVGVAEAAKILGVSGDTVRRWHKKGLVNAVIAANGERQFRLSDLSKLLQQKNSSSSNWKVLTAPKTRVSTIELFCGAGGLALGLENAGLVSKLVVDFDKDCINTIKANRPNWDARCMSVADLELNEFAGGVDVMAGGFPCQAFSYAGMKRGFEDARGTLFYEYARLIDQVKPRIVLGENVRGLTNHDNGKTLDVMVRILKNLGYEVAYKVLRSQFFDVPQKRERLIIFGIDKTIKGPIVFPEEKQYTVNLRTALAEVPESQGMAYSPAKKKVLDLVPEGGYWRDLPEKIQREFMGSSYFMGGGKTGMARRLSWEEPSLTLTCSPAQKQTERCHPSETRPLTIREYARIQCFPDEWHFTGSVTSQYKQIGNAVPVNLGYHIGLTIRKMLGRSLDDADLPPNFLKVESLPDQLNFD